MTSAASDRVANRNIALAMQAARHKASRGPSSGAIEPFMTGVRYTPRNDAVIEAEAAIKAAEQHAAGVTVASHLISRGCAGAGCKRGHAGHVETARMFLMALEVIPDPEVKPANRHGGNGGK